MQTLNTSALVLRRADWRDSDRMVTLFTPDHGKIEAVARRCRKMKSPLLNASEPFVLGTFQLRMDRERYSIEQVSVTESFYPLRTDYDRLTHGVYWLKLLDGVLQFEESAPELFMTTSRALAYLCYSDLPLELETMLFELHLLKHLGLLPVMHQCAVCGKPIDSDARYSAEAGGALCFSCRFPSKPISNGARRILMKAPRTQYDKVELLPDRPEWPEAASRIRDTVNEKLGLMQFAPALYDPSQPERQGSI